VVDLGGRGRQVGIERGRESAAHERQTHSALAHAGLHVAVEGQDADLEIDAARGPRILLGGLEQMQRRVEAGS
jgi:hypothetical protein